MATRTKLKMPVALVVCRCASNYFTSSTHIYIRGLYRSTISLKKKKRSNAVVFSIQAVR